MVRGPFQKKGELDPHLREQDSKRGGMATGGKGIPCFQSQFGTGFVE